ncbi:mechanosensitive ion channel family protein [Corynebacterium sp. sy017]|uniref:mechanosensitive ion channel family protein n=1 Tax=unclassified Corynebacterium TaxID=2624378 RepID=UPI0011867E59|nr:MULTISPECIES: mechanosensitive ion channel family protein [unclassified Corynebacterium]MBP3088197.1 mechanosensitive ion channel family protein [Corynebacterium sp. sy017]TSD92699.1 mechanosensitive ion channel family protein [Corynebacterium sp. SY003]
MNQLSLSSWWHTWWESEKAQEWLVDKPISIVLTLLTALVLHWVLGKLINKAAQININKKPARVALSLFERTGSDSAGHALSATQEQRRQSRIRTLAAVGRSAAVIFVWAWACLSILDTLGINVTPLIASAGVVGVALGFGAQSLVKDFLSGIFMLIEDQYGVGDTIDVGEITGTVENVTLRLTTLRDVNGTQWFVRNGEILRVGNFSQEYAVALINTPVSLEADPQAAIETVKRAVAACATQPEIDKVLLAEPVVDGISSVNVDHVLIRTRVTTLPDQQWFVERELTAAIIKEMKQDGIAYPRRMFRSIEPD